LRQAVFDFGATDSAPGLVFVPDFLGIREESALLNFIRGLAFRDFAMRGMTARRRIVQFGWHYSFESSAIRRADPIPVELDTIRRRAAVIAGVKAESLSEVLVTEYQAGAGIGWHRDAPPFEIVVGVSLGGECRMRFRERADHSRTFVQPLPPRSVYVLSGAVRSDWEHMIPPVKEERYSITFRSLRKNVDPQRPDQS
jgi:DNA oxidative demethylase